MPTDQERIDGERALEPTIRRGHTVMALLRDSKGFERVHTYTIDENDEECALNVEFMWSDGNYACDCNRSLFLYQDPSKELPCSPLRIHGKPTITCVWLKLDGLQIYSEQVEFYDPNIIVPDHLKGAH